MKIFTRRRRRALLRIWQLTVFAALCASGFWVGLEPYDERARVVACCMLAMVALCWILRAADMLPFTQDRRNYR